MTDRMILTLFFSMCLGTLLGTWIREVYFPFKEEVQIEIQFHPPSPEEDVKMRSKDIVHRCA